MLIVFPTMEQQRGWDQDQRLDDLCRPLLSINPDLVEWTMCPARQGEKLIAAEFILRDGGDPLGCVARRLRSIAAAVDRLRRPPAAAREAA